MLGFSHMLLTPEHTRKYSSFQDIRENLKFRITLFLKTILDLAQILMKKAQ